MRSSTARNPTGLIQMAAQDILPTPEGLLHALYPERPGFAQKFAGIVAETLEIARPLIEPRAVWALEPVDQSVRAELPPLSEELSSRLAFHFGVVCTIGARLEACSQKYFHEKSYTPGYWLDQIGTYSISLFAQKIAGQLCSTHGAVRWAPGDRRDDLALEEQRKLFDWVPAEEIGVSLTDARFMLPAKSLSFNLYAGPDLRGVSCRVACNRCVWNGSCDRR